MAALLTDSRNPSPHTHTPPPDGGPFRSDVGAPRGGPIGEKRRPLEKRKRRRVMAVNGEREEGRGRE